MTVHLPLWVAWCVTHWYLLVLTVVSVCFGIAIAFLAFSYAAGRAFSRIW